MTMLHARKLEVYSRKKALCEMCIKILNWLMWYNERTSYDLFYPVVYDLRYDIQDMEKSFTSEELAKTHF
jgi:hypothetical protein